MALRANIRPRWNGLTETNALAYFSLRQQQKKTFYSIDTRSQCYKTFFVRDLRIFVIS
jgi:hypothetical protein